MNILTIVFDYGYFPHFINIWSIQSRPKYFNNLNYINQLVITKSINILMVINTSKKIHSSLLDYYKCLQSTQKIWNMDFSFQVVYSLSENEI